MEWLKSAGYHYLFDLYSASLFMDDDSPPKVHFDPRAIEKYKVQVQGNNHCTLSIYLPSGPKIQSSDRGNKEKTQTLHIYFEYCRKNTP